MACESCGDVTRNYQVFDSLALPIGTKGSSLIQSLGRLSQKEKPNGLQCESCKEVNSRTRYTTFARLPDRLILQLNRFKSGEGSVDGKITKNRNKISFPLRGLDMTPYFIEDRDRALEVNSPHAGLAQSVQFKGPFIYDLYATVVHQGVTTHSGHYWAYVKDETSRDSETWWKLNDKNVSSLKISEDGSTSMHHHGEPYILFYRRRGV